jgi:FSR family fosmidomycin resistance protein-like MFS transporter
MNYRFVGFLSLGHLIVDINQGAVPALLPFLISEHGLSYTAAAGIVFATSFSSTLVQPLFGYAADRFSKPWLLPIGLLLAGLGISLIGIFESYRSIFLAATISGIGIAAYHPEGARLVNYAAGEKKGTAMSFFGVGGTMGFAIGPVFITSALLSFGLRGTLVLLAPVCAMAIWFFFNLHKFPTPGESKTRLRHEGDVALQDAWMPFARLTVAVIARSILFFGLNTFVPLLWMEVLDQSKAVSATALSVLAGSGIFGNLLGGRMADRFGYRRVLMIGLFLLIPLAPLLLVIKDVYLATMLLIPIGFGISSVYSPIIVLGQRYLPNRIGLSSGITLGVSVAVGGIAAPILGKIADAYGILSALAVISFLPVIAGAFSLTLPEPGEN